MPNFLFLSTLFIVMSFVRAKTIRKPSGRSYTYYYVVSNSRIQGRVVQKVEQYLGKKSSLVEK